MNRQVTEWVANKKQTALFFGVSVQALDGWMQRNCPHEKDGNRLRFYLPDVVAWRAARSESETGSLEEERIRLTKEQADNAAIQNQKLRGELVPFEDMATGWLSMASAFRSGMLSIPGKLAPILTAETIRQKVKELLDAEIEESLNELSTHSITIDAK